MKKILIGLLLLTVSASSFASTCYFKIAGDPVLTSYSQGWNKVEGVNNCHFSKSGNIFIIEYPNNKEPELWYNKGEVGPKVVSFQLVGDN